MRKILPLCVSLSLIILVFSGCKDNAPPNDPAEYADILRQYREFVLTDADDLPDYYDLSTDEVTHPWYGLMEAKYYLSNNAYGYGLKDINGDGVTELVFLVKQPGQEYIDVYAIYSLVDGTPNLLGGYWSRNHCVIKEDGAIYVHASGGAAYLWAYVYHIAPGGQALSLVEGVRMDGDLYDIIHQNGSETEISEEEGRLLFERFYERRGDLSTTYNRATGIDFIPLF